MKRLLIIVLGLAIRSAYAGGTESFTNQALPILRQNKELADALQKVFDFNDTVYAQTRLGSHTKFGGQRLGPYTVLAKPKGSRGSWTYEVTIRTTCIVYDDTGNEIPLLDENGKWAGIFDPRAAHITELFERLEIKPLHETDPNRYPPG